MNININWKCWKRKKTQLFNIKITFHWNYWWI